MYHAHNRDIRYANSHYGHIGMEDVNRQATRQSFIPKKNTGNNSMRNVRSVEDKKKHRDKQKDCRCPACGYTTRELHKLLNIIHTGDPKTCLLRCPKYLNNKKYQARVNKYNLKTKDKKVEIRENRLDKTPQRLTRPMINHVHANIDDDTESDKEEGLECDEYEYDYVEDDIEDDIYKGEETLPPP